MKPAEEIYLQCLLDDALCAGTDAIGEAIDAETERAHRVIAVSGLVA